MTSILIIRMKVYGNYFILQEKNSKIVYILNCAKRKEVNLRDVSSSDCEMGKMIHILSTEL